MHVTNVRLGFATNSSSSHSIVFKKPRDYTVPRHDPVPSAFWGGEFGWEDFALDTPGEKHNYLAVQMKHWLNGANFSQEDIVTVMRDVFANVLTFPEDDDEMYALLDDSYIDHQSVMYIGNNLEQAVDTMKLLMEITSLENVVIHGGNDNDNDGSYEPTDDELELDTRFGWLNGRYDDDNDAFVMFNRSTGAKLRMKLSPGEYGKSNLPELVDVKITDYCNMGCKFCYQGSTEAGKHAKLSDIMYVAEALKHMNVFEVALGGGETTSHPHFKQIITEFADRGIKVNFTTRNAVWLTDPELVELVRIHCGAVGVSVDTVAQFKVYEKIREVLGWKTTAQIVVGASRPAMFRDMLKHARETDANILLLGWKNVGRGETFRAHNVVNVMKEELPKFFEFEWVEPGYPGNKRWKRYSYHGTVSVDTSFANQHGDILSGLDINDKLITFREGAFSCYIDAVQMTVAKSSYEGEPYPLLPEELDLETPLYELIEASVIEKWKGF